jgi:hypothetical protein
MTNETKLDPVEVTVTGGSVEVNTVVYGVVQAALDEAGFTEVTVQSPHGDAAVEPSEMPSLLDLIRTKNPSMFDVPVKVTQHASMDAVGQLPNAGATAAAIATVVYGGVLDEAVADEAAMAWVEEPEPTDVEPLPDDIPY